ncbi:MAG TPA: hypothetical protein VGD65_12375 [Chryseosolibacter sp.]
MPPAAQTPRSLARTFILGLSSITILLCCSKPEVRFPSPIAIRDHYFQGDVRISFLRNKGFKVSLTTDGQQVDQVVFPYEAYHFDTADVNHDGSTDILLGLIKPTEFDPVHKKRLFILRVDHDQLRPLWLGSKVCQNLISFKAKSNGIIQTLEQTNNGNYAVGVYQWESFGLTLIHYRINEKPYHDAIQIFES